MHLTRIGSFLVVATMLAACGRSENAADTTLSAGAVGMTDSSASMMTAGTQPDSMAANAAAGSIRTASAASVGTYLTDANGRALYMFEKDTRNASTCMSECAEEWPPFAANSAASATTATATGTDSVQSSMVGMITRSDNARQATYNGMPLYYYHDDTKPGDIEGQGKKEFGAEWYLVAPNGEKIEKGEGGKS